MLEMMHRDTNVNLYLMHTFLNRCIINFNADAPMQNGESYLLY